MWTAIKAFGRDCWLFLGLEVEVILMGVMLTRMVLRPLFWVAIELARLLLLHTPRLVLRAMLRVGWPCAKPVYQALRCLADKARKRLPTRYPGDGM